MLSGRSVARPLGVEVDLAGQLPHAILDTSLAGTLAASTRLP